MGWFVRLEWYITSPAFVSHDTQARPPVFDQGLTVEPDTHTICFQYSTRNTCTSGRLLKAIRVCVTSGVGNRTLQGILNRMYELGVGVHNAVYLLWKDMT